MSRFREFIFIFLVRVIITFIKGEKVPLEAMVDRRQKKKKQKTQNQKKTASLFQRAFYISQGQKVGI
jgi:hypothetical protein